jgi:hypothetical protein
LSHAITSNSNTGGRTETTTCKIDIANTRGIDGAIHPAPGCLGATVDVIGRLLTPVQGTWSVNLKGEVLASPGARARKHGELTLEVLHVPDA